MENKGGGGWERQAQETADHMRHCPSKRQKVPYNTLSSQVEHPSLL